MQKHRKKRNASKSRRFANANARLQESVRNSIIELDCSIDGGENVAATYLRESYRTKFCDETLVPGSERRANAIRKFLDSEERNRATNQWWSVYDEGFNILPRVTLQRFLRFTRRLIRDILGPLHDEVVIGSFSGGASTSRRRTESFPALKFVGKADITEEALPYLDLLIKMCPMLQQYGSFLDLNFQEGNVLFTVPKKTDIDRCACKEPDINMFLQKGVGRHIRRRLLRHGVNLNDQRINKNLAYEGSRDNSLATIDLSSASDLIAHQIVRVLLPRDWYGYLNDIRSQSTRIDEETIRLEMFSSMGNGFTFELESLIFYALARATAYFEGISGVISVYGDDVVIPSGCYDAFSFVLQRFGFVVNEEKSFHDGPFRESCGGHYHLGEDITPFYLKRTPERLTDLIRVCNQLRRWSLVDPFRQYEIPSLYHVWYSLASHVPKEFWGGFDFNLDTQLVSPPGSKSILSRVADDRKVDDKAMYLFWQNSNWNRTSLSIDNGKPLSTNQKCRKRRAQKSAPVTDYYFRQEV